MATLDTRIQDLTMRIAVECKNLRTTLNTNTGALSNLTTTDKTNLVAALNELKAAIATVSSTNTNTLKIDGSQTLSENQQITLATTIGATRAADVGPTNTDYVALFLTGLI
jgi:hypothetical protein